MNAPPHVDARSLFSNWLTLTQDPDNAFWEQRIDWASQDLLEYLVQCLIADIEFYQESLPELFAEFSSSIIADLPALEDGLENDDITISVTFIRYLISSAALRNAVINGRLSFAFNWILCSIADRPYENIQPGTPIEFTIWPERPISFLASENPIISAYAPIIVGRWFADLYYSSWKYSLHNNVADLMLPEARAVIVGLLDSGQLDLVAVAIEAASQLASWLNIRNNAEARTIADALIRVYESTGLPADCRKIAGMALSTQIGRHTEQGFAVWAARTLEDFRTELVPHQECQLLGHSCTTPQQLMDRFQDLLSAYERFSTNLEAEYGQDKAGATFRRAQLFAVIAPSIQELISIGRCREVIQLVATWFGVPTEHRRTSSVLAVVPHYYKGTVFAVDNLSELHERDTQASLSRMINAINEGFDTSIAVQHDHGSPRISTGRRAPLGQVDELAEAVTNFYSIDRLRDFLINTPTDPRGCFLPQSENVPFQPLTEKMLEVTWPIVTSFQEPRADRPLKKLLLWSCGTILGGHEIRSVGAFFSAHNIDCTVIDDTEISSAEFLGFYRDSLFDAIWVNAHGEYDSHEPHQAYIKLSEDGRQTVSVVEMLQHTIPDQNRRLLLLNICLGGATYNTGSPACLGMGTMLANKNQAVISHIAEVGSFVAPLFGTLMAIGLQQTSSFFTAFRFAIRRLPWDHDTVLDLIRTEAPQCNEIVERLSSSSPGVDQDDIRTWGTPVFFE
jgi:hypothetical protein